MSEIKRKEFKNYKTPWHTSCNYCNAKLSSATHKEYYTVRSSINVFESTYSSRTCSYECAEKELERLEEHVKSDREYVKPRVYDPVPGLREDIKLDEYHYIVECLRSGIVYDRGNLQSINEMIKEQGDSLQNRHMRSKALEEIDRAERAYKAFLAIAIKK